VDLRTAFRRLEREDLERLSREHTTYRYLGNNVALTRVLDNFLLYVDTRDRSIVPHLIMDGFWEMWVTQAIAQRMQPGWRCADFGSSYGYYPMLLSRLGAQEVIAYDRDRAAVKLETVLTNGAWPGVNRHHLMGVTRNELGGAYLKLTPESHGQFDFIKISDREAGGILDAVALCAENASVLLEVDGENAVLLDKVSARYTLEKIDHDSRFSQTTADDLGKETVWLWMTPK